jgi:hypothetical protein
VLCERKNETTFQKRLESLFLLPCRAINEFVEQHKNHLEICLKGERFSSEVSVTVVGREVSCNVYQGTCEVVREFSFLLVFSSFIWQWFLARGE